MKLILQIPKNLSASVEKSAWQGLTTVADVDALDWDWCNIIWWDAPLSSLVYAVNNGDKAIRVLLESNQQFVDHHHLLDQITLADAYGLEEVYFACFRAYWSGAARERAHWRNILNACKDFTGTHDNPHIFFSLQDRGLPVPEVVAAE